MVYLQVNVIERTALTMAKNSVISSPIYAAIKPLYVVCQVFGLVPCCFKKDRISGNKPTAYDVINVVYCMVWLTFDVVGLCLYQSLQIMDTMVIEMKLQLLWKIDIICTLITSIICLVRVSIIGGMKIIELLDKVSQVDSKLLTVNEERCVNRKTKSIIITELVIILFLNISYDIYDIHAYVERDVNASFTEVTFFTSFICNTLTGLLFTNSILIVTQRHRYLNKLLATFSPCPDYVNRMRFFGHLHRSTKRNTTVPHVSSVSVVRTNDVSRGQQIHSIRILYNNIYVMVCLINSVYGLPILAMTCCVLVDLVSIVYGLLCCFKNHFLIDTFHYVFFLLMFVKIAVVCQFAENERESSRIIVQKLLLEDSLEDDYCKELTMLSAQLRDMKIKYTACGFFTLNLPYLCSVTGLIISYVIIVAQLK